MNQDLSTNRENQILRNQYFLTPLYDNIWKSCSKKERYFLYDLAEDGLINYKRVNLVHQLFYKGLLREYDGDLKIMSVSFRNYILEKKQTKEISSLKEQFHVQGTWSKLRTPILVIITAIGSFFFITQQDLLQRVAALIPTLSAILGLGTMILGSKSQAGGAK